MFKPSFLFFLLAVKIMWLTCWSQEELPPAATAALKATETASPVIQPAATIRNQFLGTLPASPTTGLGFTVYHIVVRDEHSSLEVSLTGEDGDVDLLLTQENHLINIDQAILSSMNSNSDEELRLSRDTLPQLTTGDYYLYVLYSTPGEQSLELSVRLNLPEDEGLQEVPSLAEGVRPLPKEEASSTAFEAEFNSSAQVSLAQPQGTLPQRRYFRILVPENTRGLDIHLLGNASDLDLLLEGPIPEEISSSQLQFSSTNAHSNEQINVRSRTRSNLPAGEWTLILDRLDQNLAEPLLLRIDMHQAFAEHAPLTE